MTNATVYPNECPSDISKEVDALRKSSSDVAQNAGKYVLVQGANIVSYFRSYRDAINEGYKKFGLSNFLVRQVTNPDTCMVIMRCGVTPMDNKLRLKKSKAKS